MTRTLKGLAAALLLSTAGIGTAQTDSPATSAGATVTVHADTRGPTYDRRIFKQFAVNFSTGIY